MPELAGKPNFLEIMLGFAELFSCGIRREPQKTLKKPKYCSFVLETLNFLESKSGFQDTWQLLDQNNRIARGLRAAQGMGSCQERPWQMPLFSTTGTWRLFIDCWACYFIIEILTV